MIDHEHASRYTADMFIAPGSVVGFFPAYHHFAIPWHDHDFYELGIVESGSGLHVGPGGSEPFRRGTVVLVPPGAGHEYRSCVEMRVLNCFFRAELDELELAWAFRDPGLRRLFNPTGVDRPQGRPSGRRAPARRARAVPDARGPGGHPRAAARTSHPARGAGAPAGRPRLPRGRRRDRARARARATGDLAARRAGVRAPGARPRPIPGRWPSSAPACTSGRSTSPASSFDPSACPRCATSPAGEPNAPPGCWCRPISPSRPSVRPSAGRIRRSSRGASGQSSA